VIFIFMIRHFTRLLGLFLFFFLYLPVSLNAAELPPSPAFVVHLLDYLAQDYRGAVSGGTVISESEYQEQIEFSQSALETYERLSEGQKNPQLKSDLEKLQALIRQKADPDKVEQWARSLQSRLIQQAGVENAPRRWPDRVEGGRLFEKNCIACHGSQGKGDGPLAGSLNPKPADLLDASRMDGLSPFQIYNTIRFGIPKTGMAPFSQLSDHEIWALAFYVSGLRYEGMKSDQKTGADNVDIPLETLASTSDTALIQQLSGSLEERKIILAGLRLTNSEKSGTSLSVARNYLNDSLQDYKNGARGPAKQKALLAYLEGVEPLEPRIRALDPSLTSEVETQMANFRSLIEKGAPTEELQKTRSGLDLIFEKVDSLLIQASPSLGFIFLMACSIILREGFEAVLIIVAILGVLRIVDEKRAKLWVHGGWASALVCGLLLWMVSGLLLSISGAGRELMEGVTSLIAVFVLLYVGFWLHSKTEIHRWTKFIDERTRKALAGGSYLGLASISFMAVFREAFETVLFLRALWLEGGAQAKTMMSLGVLSSFVLIFILAYALLRFSVKLPLQKLFNFSALLMSFLAIVLTGKGLHSLQETGVLTVTASPLKLRLDLLGFYPTVETLLPQLAVLILIVALWFYGKRSFGLKTT